MLSLCPEHPAIARTLATGYPYAYYPEDDEDDEDESEDCDE